MASYPRAAVFESVKHLTRSGDRGINRHTINAAMKDHGLYVIFGIVAGLMFSGMIMMRTQDRFTSRDAQTVIESMCAFVYREDNRQADCKQEVLQAYIDDRVKSSRFDRLFGDTQHDENP